MKRLSIDEVSQRQGCQEFLTVMSDIDRGLLLEVIVLSRTTSGVMEGINNRIKLIKRQAYGFVNFDNFRARLLACFSD